MDRLYPVAKKLLLCLGLITLLSVSDSCSSSEVDIQCTGSTYNGNQLILGPKGGCYYNNSNGNKTYVDRSYCHC